MYCYRVTILVRDDVARIVFLTIYDRFNKPCFSCIKTKNANTIIELYKPGIRKPIKEVRKAILSINRLLTIASDEGHEIITSDFKRAIKAFELPIDSRDYNIYDIHLTKSMPYTGSNNDMEIIKKAADKIYDNYKTSNYQKLLSNVSVVYQDLENRGLILNDINVRPIWSLQTYSGRSKSLEFNIQGYSDNDYVRAPNVVSRSVLIHFDWISADLRAAAILSKDNRLVDSFLKSDPYTILMDHINNNATDSQMSREECKLFMLKSINSMDTNDILYKAYPKLCDWIESIRTLTGDSDGYAQTIMHRRFKMSSAKNALAVLNGAMQGSVAHAMHNVLRNVWLKCGSSIVADIHDSLVLSVPEDQRVINATIDTVLPIMMYPFEGLLPDSHCFPVKVSIGRKWKKWKLLKTYRGE